MTDFSQSPSKRFHQMPHCPSCGAETPLHAQVCPSCGSSMKSKAAPRETSDVWDEGSWQSVPPKFKTAKQPPRVRRHRFHLRPQLIGTILLVIVAFSAGLAIGPYITPYRSIQNIVPMTVTVMTTVEGTLTTSAGTSYQTTSATVLQTLTTTTGQRPKWISSSTNVVSYLQAANYLGQSKIVEDKIVRTYASSKGTVFLDFHDPYQGYFQVTIFASDVKNFPFSPVSFYLNKEVRVTGTIEMYQGAPEIIVHSPSQIEVANMGFNYP